MKTSKRTSGSRKRSARRPGKAPKKSDPLVAAYAATLAFASFAAKHDLRWYVFGALAVNLHGYPRTTGDVDVTVALDGIEPRAFVKVLAKAGFVARFSDDAFLTSTHVIPVVHTASMIPMDIVLAGAGLEEHFLANVVVTTVEGKAIPVIAPEHLVVTKVLAGRPKDLEDVREILAMHELDHSIIESLLAQIEEAIADSELLARYRRLREGG